MKERPILFSAPMVRAILKGTKTQTRRILKLPAAVTPDVEVGESIAEAYSLTHVQWLDAHQAGPGFYAWSTEYPEEGSAQVRCRYGKPGGRLWVKESWGNMALAGYPPVIAYRADAEDRPGWVLPPGFRWRPSIHMPRWASRIMLDVTSVRVERLQNISRGDCMAEGCPFPNMAGQTDPVAWYRELWESINGPHSWDDNPWVWVVEFKRVEGGEA